MTHLLEIIMNQAARKNKLLANALKIGSERRLFAGGVEDSIWEGARSLGATALKYLDIEISVCRGSSVLVLKNTIGPTTRTWRER